LGMTKQPLACSLRKVARFSATVGMVLSLGEFDRGAIAAL